MPAVDPNVYALSIQLQLDSQEAFSTLDRFGESITAVEEQMAKAADKALHNINNIVQQIETSLMHVTDLIGQMDMSAVKVASSLDSINRSTTDSQKTTEEDLDNLLKQRDLWEEVVDFYAEVTESLEQHLKLHTRDVKLLDDIHQAILTKNIGHNDQNKFIDAGNKGLQHGNKLARGQRDAVKAIADMWHSVSAALAGTVAYYAKVDQGTEAFVQTNYRAYGSQQLLLQSTRQLSTELGVSAETAIATYKALADVRTPREEIEKYAQVVAMANRTTGANIQTLAIYTARMRALGLTAGPLQQHIARLTEQMRKFGLTADDVNRLMNNTSSSAADLRDLFGGNTEEVKKFEATFAALSGMAKQYGWEVSQIAQFQKNATNPEQWISLGNQTDMAIQGAEDYQAALLKIGSQLSTMQAEMDAAGGAVTNQGMQIQKAMIGLLEAIGANEDSGKALIDMYRQASKEAGGAASSAADFQRVMDTMSNSMDNQYAESMAALYAEFERLKNTFGALSSSVLQFVADGLMYLISALNKILYPISVVITKVLQFINLLEKIPILGRYITYLKIIVAVLVVAGAVFLAAAGGISIFALAVGSASGIVTGAINIVTSMAQAMVSVARAVGESIVIILQSLGQGLAALGRSVQPVMLPLLALGLALMMVGAAAWMFAQAVKTIAEVGEAAIKVTLGMLVAIGLLGLMLVGLGYLAGPVAGGVLAIAGAILLVGLAAMLMGLGIMWAAQGLQIMAQVISVGLVTQLPTLALGLIALGLAALVAAPGLVLLGVALLFVGLGLTLIASALVLLSTALENLSGVKLVQVATGFLQASLIFIAAAGIAIVAGVLLLAASIILVPAALALLVASLILSLAGVIFFIAASMIAIGAALLAVGVSLLLPVAAMVFTAGVMIGVGGLMMLAGMIAMLAAVALMTGLSFILLLASIALGTAIALLVPIAGMVMGVGVLMYVGGLMMVMAGTLMVMAGMLFTTGGLMLMASAAYLYMAGTMMMIAGSVLVDGSMVLIIASTWLFVASLEMLKAGMAILPGSYMIYLGLSLLQMAVSRFANTIEQIKIVGEGILKLATAFKMIQDIPASKLKDVAADALNALPDIDALATGLDQVSGKLAESTRRFAGPANELAEVLERLGTAISQFGEGLSLAEDVGQLANMLDQYASLLEGAADRMETAVQTRAIPAMRAAEQAGLQEAVRSEAITTVQVMTDSEGGEDDSTDLAAIGTAQLVALLALQETVAGLQPSRSGPIQDIVSLLQAYLPAMARKDTGLSTEFNAWAK